MSGIFRRVNLHAALVLLLSGLFQPLVAAQGVTCARLHAPASAMQQTGESGGVSANELAGRQGDVIEHQHAPAPESGDPGAVTAPCSVALFPAAVSSSPTIVTLRHLLPADEATATLHLQSHFRPPRLS